MENRKALKVTVFNPPKNGDGANQESRNDLYAQLTQVVRGVFPDLDEISVELKRYITEDHLNFESATVLVCCEWSERTRNRIDDKKVRDAVFKWIGTMCGVEYDPNSLEALHLRHAVAIDDWKVNPALFLVTGRVCKPR